MPLKFCSLSECYSSCKHFIGLFSGPHGAFLAICCLAFDTGILGEGGHDRISRHVRTPLYRPRGVISGLEIVLHGVILPQLPLFARAGRIYWLE